MYRTDIVITINASILDRLSNSYEESVEYIMRSYTNEVLNIKKIELSHINGKEINDIEIDDHFIEVGSMELEDEIK